MRVPINLDSEHVSSFLDYLRAIIETKQSWHSEGTFDDEGCFFEKVHLLLPLKEDTIPIVLTISWMANGTLAPLVAEAEDSTSADWEEEIQIVVRDALIATINKPTTRLFCRNIYAYIGLPLDGEYYVRGYRFAPAVHPDEPEMGPEERVLYIDLNSDGINEQYARAIGKIKAERTASVLSVIMNIGLYQIPIERRWVFTSSTESRRLQLGFRMPSPNPTSMPAKGQECTQGRTQPVDRRKIREEPSGEMRLLAPDDIRLLFRIIDELPPEEKEAFWSAAGLFRVSLTAGRYSPSVKMSYQIAAADALQRGKERSLDVFIDFVCQYCPEIPREWIKLWYGKIRSGHFHSGDFPGGEYEPFIISPIMTPDFVTKIYQQSFVHDVMRAVLIRWLLEHGKQSGI